MAGHFVVWSLSPADKDDFLARVHQSGWSALAHAANANNGAGGVFPGWTDASRAELNSVRNGTSQLLNRNNLPPHRYLQTSAANPINVQDQQLVDHLRQCSWASNLVRPGDPGFGVTALAPAAQAAWDAGDRMGAFIAQTQHGSTSIEVYYLGSKEMY